MTTPDAPQGRPVPDTDDLRLLAEIINNGAIGLPQAAWNARMSQAEAAARFVTMAERGMPLRLVAEGDRQLLWSIAQAGPATGGVQVRPDAGVPAPPQVPQAPAPPPFAGPAPVPGPPPFVPPSVGPPLGVESQPVQQLPVVSAPDVRPPANLPPVSAVPPHEQAIAGAVPLGQPPFGTPPSEATPDATAAAPAAVEPAAATWGLPGTSDWARSDEPKTNGEPASVAAPQSDAAPGAEPQPVAEPGPVAEPEAVGEPGPVAGPEAAAEPQVEAEPESAVEPELEAERHPDMTQAYPPPSRFGEDEPSAASPAQAMPPPFVPRPFVPPPLPPGLTGPQPEPPPASQPQPQSPTRRVMTSGQPMQSVVGLFGEHLDVSLQNIIDPADQILTLAGYQIEAHERALLVQTSIGNRGPIDYESLPDLYLVLVTGTGTVLAKAAMSVAGYPAHRVGVAANTQVSGWTVFLVPRDAEVAEVRWSVRPDLQNRTISWGFGPG